MRTFVVTRCLSVAVAVMIMVAVAAPASAQQYAGTRNQEIGTVGDMPAFLLKPNTKATRLSLRFGPAQLFGDSEVFSFNPPRPFVFPLPDFAERGFDFTDMTYEEYLTFVANSYELQVPLDYLFRFQIQNSVTAEFPDFIPTFDDITSVHQSDFLAGGGYLPLPGGPTIPSPPFTGLPFPGLPDPNATAESDLIDSVSASASQQLAAASVAVPEPATVGLLALGVAGCLVRRR